MSLRFLRLKDVIRVTGLSRSSIYDFMYKGKFPRQINLGGRTVAWVESEIQEWMQNKIKDRTIS